MPADPATPAVQDGDLDQIANRTVHVAAVGATVFIGVQIFQLFQIIPVIYTGLKDLCLGLGRLLYPTLYTGLKDVCLGLGRLLYPTLYTGLKDVCLGLGRLLYPPLHTGLKHIFLSIGRSHFPTMRTPIPEMNKVLSKGQIAQIGAALQQQPWSKGREFRINPETKTISLFGDAKARAPSSDVSGTIPLRFRGLPIIPHDRCRIIPKNVLVGADTEVQCDGLSDEQVKRLCEEIPGIVAIDVYIDREAHIVVTPGSHEAAFLRLRGPAFLAWGLTFVLVVQEAGQHRYEPEWQDEHDDSDDTLEPGSRIYNLRGEFSTVGAFLVPKQTESNRSENLRFTVSAHSFIRKKDSSFGFNFYWLFALPLVTWIAYRTAYHEPALSTLLLKQYLAVRFFIILHDCLWKYSGRRLGLHSMPGNIVIEYAITKLGLTLIYSIPVIVRLFAAGLIEIAIPVGRDLLIIWIIPILVELMVTYWALSMLRELVNGSDTRRPSEIVQSWMYPILRSSIGLNKPFPFSHDVPFWWAFMMRWICSIFEEPHICFSSWMLLIYDVIRAVWSLDIPLTYALKGEPVLNENGRKIGNIVLSLESNASFSNVHKSSSDIAIAVPEITLPLNGWKRVSWLKRPLRPGTQVRLLAKHIRTGTFEDDEHQVVQSMNGILGGWHYTMSALLRHPEPSYNRDTAIIWRSEDVSITGDSGGMILSAEEGTWNVVGFQSHQLPQLVSPLRDPSQPPIYWKIAYKPPKPLIDEFVPVLPRQVIARLSAGKK